MPQKQRDSPDPDRTGRNRLHTIILVILALTAFMVILGGIIDVGTDSPDPGDGDVDLPTGPDDGTAGGPGDGSDDGGDAGGDDDEDDETACENRSDATS